MRVGEDSQDTGALGVRLAKKWLDLTTRVEYSGTARDPLFRDLLVYTWPGTGKPYSFDLGGRFRGDELEDQGFAAEVKKYGYEMDLPDHFRGFLAKCYNAEQTSPHRFAHYMWISWAPFQAQKWHEHTSRDNVVKALLHRDYIRRLFDTEDEAVAKPMVDHDVVRSVSDKLWLLTLCDKQEQLVLTRQHYADVIARIKSEGID